MNKILYIVSGQKLKVKNSQLIIEAEEISTVIEPKYISTIVVESVQCSLTVKAMLVCQEHGIPIIVCNEKCQPIVLCDSLHSYYRLTDSIKEQIEWKEEDKLSFFKAIICLKVLNQKIVLDEFGFKEDALKVHNYLSELDMVTDFERIDQIEAISARIYFKALFGKQFNREADCLVNSGLNYGYALLRSVIVNVIVAKGLHPSLGIHHHSQFNNYNLADDLIEIFRPMVDYLVYLIDKSYVTFDKSFRMKLQCLLKQKMMYNDEIVVYKQAIIYMIDLLKNYMNGSVDVLKFPMLKIELYEY